MEYLNWINYFTSCLQYFIYLTLCLKLKLGLVLKWGLRGFVKLKKSKNPRKTWKWVGRSSPNPDFFYFLLLFIFVCFVHVSKCFQKIKNKWIGGGDCSPIRVFLKFLDFFNLTKTPKETNEARVHSFKLNLMILSEAGQIFLRIIKYLSTTCPLDNYYLIHENLLSKYLF